MITLGQLLTVAALSVAVSGCGILSWTRVTINEPLSDTDAAFIVPGQTPVAEVVAHLGAPEDMVLSEDGAVVRYYYRDIKYFRANYGWPLQFISAAVSLIPHDLIAEGGGLGTDVLQVAFDLEWKVKHYAFGRHAKATRYRPWPFGDAR
jgi:hypothetical protein